MTEVFGLHGAANLQWQILVHLQEHVSHVNVLASVAVLVTDCTDHEGHDLSHVVGASLCEVRVDDHGSEGDSTQGESPCLVAHQLLPGQIRLEVVIETVISSVPVDVLFQVLVSQEIISWIIECVAGSVLLAEDIRADTSKEKSVSLLTHCDY